MSLRIGIVAGEMSGDILGAGLLEVLKSRYPDAVFEGIGGPRMEALGFHSFFPMDRLSVMGLLEPLKRLPELLRIRKFIKNHFSENPPDLFLGIDSPDFNLNIERHLRRQGIATAHYVSPSVWAWRQGRVKKIKQSVDLMLTLLPFEARFYQEHQVPVTFVGHPLADQFDDEPHTAEARQALGLADHDEILAVMPGSRGGEVKLLGPVFAEVMALLHRSRPQLKFVVPAANAARRQQLEQLLADYRHLPLTLVDGNSHQVMEAADVILMASGTTTLEAMLLKKPMVVSYKLSWLTYQLFFPLIKIPFYSLPNLLAGRAIVPELMQDEATPAKISAAVQHWFEQPKEAQALTEQFHTLHRQIRCSASERAADALLALIGKPEA